MDDIIGRLDHNEPVHKALGMEEHFHGGSEPPAGSTDGGGED
jgi:hypothetical protein